MCLCLHLLIRAYITEKTKFLTNGVTVEIPPAIYRSAFRGFPESGPASAFGGLPASALGSAPESAREIGSAPGSAPESAFPC